MLFYNRQRIRAMETENKEQVQFQQFHLEVDCLKSVELLSCFFAAFGSCKPSVGQALHAHPLSREGSGPGLTDAPAGTFSPADEGV